MKNLLTFCVTAVALLLYSPLSGQKSVKKFGSLKKPIGKLPEFAESAPAMYIFDSGKYKVEYVEHEGQFMLVADRHFQIHIQNKEGFDYADIEIPLMASGAKKEKVTSLRALTYNWEGNKMEKSKLDTRKVYTEEESENRTTKKFAMPNVREGSIIEVQYVVQSPFLFNLDRWEFQKEIPVALNRFRVTIPEYLVYRIQEKGYIPHYKYNHSSTRIIIPLTATTTASARGGSGTVSYRANEYLWEYRDVEAFKDERYTTSIRNYASAVEFELAATRFPGEPAKDLSRTWASLDNELITNQGFGKRLSNMEIQEDDWPADLASAKLDKTGIQAAVVYVSQRIHWNGESHLFAGKKLKECLEEGEGNSAEINLTLVAVLRKMGFEAHPVILGTRKHGQPYHTCPRFSDFNYVIASVLLPDDSIILVDATAPELLAGYLPWRCLNGSFRMITEDGGIWVDYKVPVGRSVEIINCEVNAEGFITGNVSASEFGYFGLGALKDYRKAGSSEKMAEEEIAEDGLVVADFEMENPQVIREEVKFSYQFRTDRHISQVEDLLLISPSIISPMEENPFQAPERKFPVDFGHPFEETQIILVRYPSGYSIESLPETKIVKLGDGKGIFLYQVSDMGEGQLQITKKVKVNEPVFYAFEYQPLKQFFDLLVEKEAEQIVLKKD